MSRENYAELHVTSNFSFLRGASHPEEMVERAADLGYRALALTDRNTLAGVVRAHEAALRTGLHFIPGARLDLDDAPSLLCLAATRRGYGALARLITTGRRRAPKGECRLARPDVVAASDAVGDFTQPASSRCPKRFPRTGSSDQTQPVSP